MSLRLGWYMSCPQGYQDPPLQPAQQESWECCLGIEGRESYIEINLLINLRM